MAVFVAPQQFLFLLHWPHLSFSAFSPSDTSSSALYFLRLPFFLFSRPQSASHRGRAAAGQPQQLRQQPTRLHHDGCSWAGGWEAGRRGAFMLLTGGAGGGGYGC